MCCWTQGRDLPCLQWHNSNTHFKERRRNKGICHDLRGFYFREGYVSYLFFQEWTDESVGMEWVAVCKECTKVF